MAQKIKLELTEKQARAVLNAMTNLRSDLGDSLLTDQAKNNRKLFDLILESYNRVDNIIGQLREPVLI